eukprot:TRINITY_DN24383_c0_g1_i1.p1 TRINITY_DN24383_c0_g1~~TRINITY_DN24383_c0_g1_i1.p1  ORF type:complete len:628 (+),score=175.38 TRINITY_DN24383_c0_g1_i1:44-1885(+)
MRGTGRGTKKARSERQKTTFKRAYLTKAQAARRLQVTNAEFERLVILKGIYPREPKRYEGSSGKDKSYYFAKDILWLEREPLLQKMRDFAAFKKKLTKLRGRRMDYDAKVHEQTRKPNFSLATIIKERYPTFVDALRDCEDALTHIFLYAALPPRVHSDSTIEGHTYLTSSMADQCREIRDRWMKYINSTNGLRKTFISIKGIYYQSNVMGENVMWQCPYEFTSKPPKEVVYRVLMTFLEFYLQQMRFILFKLEHDQRLAEEKKISAEEDAECEEGAAEDFPVSEEEVKKNEKVKRHISLFEGMTFFISRECPKIHIKFICESFKGKVVDTMEPGKVTHCIIDRPALAPGDKKVPGVDYVQPQWLFDCINAKGKLPVDEYLMGKQLPPHVSPFRISISNDPDEIAELKEAIALDRNILENDIPDRVHEIRRMLDPTYDRINPLAHIDPDDEDEDEDDAEDAALVDDEVHSTDDESDAPTEDSEGNIEVKEHITRSKKSKRKLVKQQEIGDNKPTPKEVAEKKKKLIQEKKKARREETVDTKKRRKLEEQESKDAADKEMKMAVMENKPRKLYKAMQIGIKSRKKVLDNLEDRRTKIREGKAKFDPKTRALKME